MRLIPEIRTSTGKLLDTRNLPYAWWPIFCDTCGERLGWCDTDYGETDQVILRCDDCAADLRDDEHVCCDCGEPTEAIDGYGVRRCFDCQEEHDPPEEE